jgi:hypothetical protein
MKSVCRRSADLSRLINVSLDRVDAKHNPPFFFSSYIHHRLRAQAPRWLNRFTPAEFDLLRRGRS